MTGGGGRVCVCVCVCVCMWMWCVVCGVCVRGGGIVSNNVSTVRTDTEWMVEAGNNNMLVVSLPEPPAQRNCTRVR